MDKKGGKGQSVSWKAWWRQGNIKCAVSEGYASRWVHQDCRVADEQKRALKAAGVSGRKDECQLQLKGKECDYWMETEIGMLGGYRFQGQVTADGSDKKGNMGSGCNNLRRKKEKQQCKVRREENGSSSNRSELAAFLLALCATPIEESLLYLCDNQSSLKAVNRVIGEGRKATLAGAPADILGAAIEILRKRIAVGTTTYWSE